MIVVHCMNKYGKRFDKEFDSPYLARNYIYRCLYGHNVYVEGFTTDSQEANQELSQIRLCRYNIVH